MKDLLNVSGNGAAGDIVIENSNVALAVNGEFRVGAITVSGRFVRAVKEIIRSDISTMFSNIRKCFTSSHPSTSRKDAVPNLKEYIETPHKLSDEERQETEKRISEYLDCLVNNPYDSALISMEDLRYAAVGKSRFKRLSPKTFRCIDGVIYLVTKRLLESAMVGRNDEISLSDEFKLKQLREDWVASSGKMGVQLVKFKKRYEERMNEIDVAFQEGDAIIPDARYDVQAYIDRNLLE